jgi:hypothetical protein
MVFLWGFMGEKVFQMGPQAQGPQVRLCRALSEDFCPKVVTNARVRLKEVLRQNGGHNEHVLH